MWICTAVGDNVFMVTGATFSAQINQSISCRRQNLCGNRGNFLCANQSISCRRQNLCAVVTGATSSAQINQSVVGDRIFVVTGETFSKHNQSVVGDRAFVETEPLW